MSGPERFDDITHELVTGLDQITVPPSTLRARAPRRGATLFAAAASALVVVAALAVGIAIRPANDGVVAPAAATATATAAVTRTPASTRARALSEAEAKRLVEPTAIVVVNALKSRFGAQLALVVHPDKGVRFSMYPYVRTDRDQVLTAADIAVAFADPTVRLWGITDGKGDEVRASFADYDARYVYDVDYAKAPEVAYNRAIGTGNTVDNSATVYPDAVMVEFHYPGFDPKLGGMDWRSLRLFLEQKDGSWFLVGVVHGEWTI